MLVIPSPTSFLVRVVSRPKSRMFPGRSRALVRPQSDRVGRSWGLSCAGPRSDLQGRFQLVCVAGAVAVWGTLSARLGGNERRLDEARWRRCKEELRGFASGSQLAAGIRVRRKTTACGGPGDGGCSTEAGDGGERAAGVWWLWWCRGRGEKRWSGQVNRKLRNKIEIRLVLICNHFLKFYLV